MRVQIGFLILALTTALFALTPTQVLTCDCAAPPPPKEALAKATAVFMAKVVKIDDDPASPSGRRVTLQVERWWKGGEAATVTVSTQKSGAACGYGFKKDDRYLVYAHAEKGKTELHVSLCSRTRTMKEADKSGDVKEIGEGKAPAVK